MPAKPAKPGSQLDVVPTSSRPSSRAASRTVLPNSLPNRAASCRQVAELEALPVAQGPFVERVLIALGHALRPDCPLPMLYAAAEMAARIAALAALAGLF